MLALLSMLALVLQGQLPPASAAGSEAPAATSPRTRESVLPPGALPAETGHGGVTGGLLASRSVDLAFAPGGAVAVDPRPAGRLRVLLPQPGTSFLPGARELDEVALPGGGRGPLRQPGVREAWRYWFGPWTGLATVGGWSTLLSTLGADGALDGRTLVTHTFREGVAVDLAARGLGGPLETTGLTLGTGRIGLRTLPLVRVPFASAWALELDAQVRFQVQPFFASSQQVLVGASARW